MAFSLVINSELECRLWIGDLEFKTSFISHILPVNKITRKSEILNIIAFLKSKIEQNEEAEPSQIIQSCVKNLRQCINKMTKEESDRIVFLSEQLNLLTTKPFTRRYSPSLIATSILWENISPALYKQIVSEGLLCLPSSRHLKSYTSAVNVDSGLPDSTIKYLRARIAGIYFNQYS